MNAASQRDATSPATTTPALHFMAQRADHWSPALLGNDALDRAVGSLERKRRSLRRASLAATLRQVAMVAGLVAGGIAVMTLGPAPVIEFMQRRRPLATTWDVFAWWAIGLALLVVGGAVGISAIREGGRRSAGWRNRAAEVARRLAAAKAEQRSRRH
ncbi:MAG: hypothetical protein IT356_07580 [Gemmatimonadaceae bacterium]|nr:hypothetical protein [Gemmatimonadaceae bacterium]